MLCKATKYKFVIQNTNCKSVKLWIILGVSFFLIKTEIAYSQLPAEANLFINQLFFNIPIDSNISGIIEIIQKDSSLSNKFKIEESTYPVAYQFEKHPVIKNKEVDNHFWVCGNEANGGYSINMEISFQSAYKEGLLEYNKVAKMLKKYYARSDQYKFYRALLEKGNTQVYKITGLTKDAKLKLTWGESACKPNVFWIALELCFWE